MRRAKIELRKPIWNGRKPHIGVADFKLNGVDEVAVSIEYTNKHGQKTYPGTFTMKTEELKKYPTQVVRGRVRLYVAPLRDFEVTYKEEA